MKQKRPCIVITKLPHWSYFQWFLLGFYQLKAKKEIDLRFKVDALSRISLFLSNKYLYAVMNRYLLKEKSYTLEGYCLVDNIKKYFCIDCADSPFLFDSVNLEKVSIYFKMQCPVSIEEKGFPLTDKVYIPYCDHQHVDAQLNLLDKGERKTCDNLFQYLYKVKPLMVGPRRLADGNDFHGLKKAYENYLKSSAIPHTKKLMCYFGNALGPEPVANVSNPDFNSEIDIVSWFSESINHPNEKRDKAAELISQLGNDYDARIISRYNADAKKAVKREDLIIPLNRFCDYIAQFQYNFNISGYRMSIPNRFVESFMAGTAILTDKLKLKWYLPFGKEVFETVEMGYLPSEEVNWSQFEEDFRNLPSVDKKEVLSEFNKKWAPEIVAKYIINTIIYENFTTFVSAKKK